MRILIINPNSDPEMTAAIQASADRYARGEFEVVCRSTPGAPRFIETYADDVVSAPGRKRRSVWLGTGAILALLIAVTLFYFYIESSDLLRFFLGS